MRNPEYKTCEKKIVAPASMPLRRFGALFTGAKIEVVGREKGKVVITVCRK